MCFVYFVVTIVDCGSGFRPVCVVRVVRVVRGSVLNDSTLAFRGGGEGPAALLA